MSRKTPTAARLVLVFHFGVVIGKNKALVYLAPCTKKTCIANHPVSIPVSEFGYCAELRVSNSVPENLVVADRGFCSNPENMALPASENDRLDPFRGSIQSRCRPFFGLVHSSC